jgi:thymidylate kinase
MSPDKVDPQPFANDPFLITFSGIDGAGKTTQIELLSSYLQAQGFSVVRLSFWDDVAVWSRMRAGAGDKTVDLYRADQRKSESVSPKNNKHIRKWYLSLLRSCFYVFDVARLRRVLASPTIKDSDIVIFDRYVYDQIANLYSQSFVARLYRRMLLRQTPYPDLAFMLDTSPDAAFARKPEYPLEFMYRNRRNFLRLRELVPLIVIVAGEVEDVKNEICDHVSRSRLVKLARAAKTEVARGKDRTPATELL